MPIAGGAPALARPAEGWRQGLSRARTVPPQRRGLGAGGQPSPVGKAGGEATAASPVGAGDKDPGAQGPPSTPHACTHCHGRGAGPAPSPQPHGRHTGGGRGEGTRFWSFNTCRIKFVSVQSAVGKGPSMLRGKFLPAGSRSSPVASLTAAPGSPRPWGRAHRFRMAASRGCVHPITVLGGSRVPPWGCADAGAGQGCHPWGWPSSPAQSRAVSTLSSLSKPRHCPGSGLSTGAACKETCKPERLLRAGPGAESFGPASPTPIPEPPAQTGPSLHGSGSVPSPGTRSHLPAVRPAAAAAEAEQVEGEQEAAGAEDDLHGVEQEGDGPEGQRGALRTHGAWGPRTPPPSPVLAPTAHGGLT